MTDRIDSVTIVGGGDAGLLAGLALRQLNRDLDVAIVDDFSQPNPQVGKASFLEIRSLLHGQLEIDERRFIQEVKPVWKLSAWFRDWCDYPEFQYPFDPGTKFPGENTPNAVERYYAWYDQLYRDPDHRTIAEEIVAQGKSPWHFDTQTGEYDRYDSSAYHLDTDRFNSFLQTLCRERDVSLVDDEIVEVESDGQRIQRLRSKRQTYESDLYVDATGFSRALRSELPGEFEDFPIPLDKACTVNVERPLSDVVPATIVDSGEYGWYWGIDTYDHRDLGYVFASDYVSDEDAKAEFVEHWEDDLAQWDATIDPDDVLIYEFDSGYYKPSWQGNCVPIGNSAGFMEPLQAPALTTNAKAAVKLSTLLSAHGRYESEQIKDSFNAWVSDAWESIYDFITIHYRYSSGDNEFWQAMQDIPISRRIELLIEEFDAVGLNRALDPTKTHPDVPSFELFQPMSFYVIMRNMGATSEFYETNRFDVSEEFLAEQREIDGATTDHVDSFLTHEEIYKTVIEAE